MKQNITIDQWKEISEKQRDIMRDGWIFDHPLEVFSLPTIGQMIEFLATHDVDWEDICVEYLANDLCDVLWEACVSVLNKP